MVCWSFYAEGVDCLRLTPPLHQETNSHSALPKTAISKTVNNNNNNKDNVNVIKQKSLTLCKRKKV